MLHSCIRTVLRHAHTGKPILNRASATHALWPSVNRGWHVVWPHAAPPRPREAPPLPPAEMGRSDRLSDYSECKI
jgi:hypothetical protein